MDQMVAVMSAFRRAWLFSDSGFSKSSLKQLDTTKLNAHAAGDTCALQ